MSSESLGLTFSTLLSRSGGVAGGDGSSNVSISIVYVVNIILIFIELHFALIQLSLAPAQRVTAGALESVWFGLFFFLLISLITYLNLCEHFLIYTRFVAFLYSLFIFFLFH